MIGSEDKILSCKIIEYLLTVTILIEILESFHIHCNGILLLSYVILVSLENYKNPLVFCFTYNYI